MLYIKMLQVKRSVNKNLRYLNLKSVTLSEGEGFDRLHISV